MVEEEAEGPTTSRKKGADQGRREQQGSVAVSTWVGDAFERQCSFHVDR